MELARELSDFLGVVEERIGASLVDGDAGPGVKGDTLMEAARHLVEPRVVPALESDRGVRGRRRAHPLGQPPA